MEEHGRQIRKNKNKTKKKKILTIFSIIFIFSLGVFLGNRMATRKNVVVNAANKEKNTSTNSQEEAINRRESKVDLDKINSEDKNESPGEYKPWMIKRSDGKKIAYLTFDDGPSLNNTPKVLDILKQNNIKATFFLIGKNAEANKDLVKREIEEGNIVGNHTYSHQLNYKEGPEKFVEDLDKCNGVLKSIIGDNYNVKLVRFPGGSFGPKLAPFRDAVTKAGYHYINWNDLTGDAEHNNVPVDSLLSELKKYTNSDTVVILMHDASAKTTTVQALPQVIDYLKSKGYSFDTLK